MVSAPDPVLAAMAQWGAVARRLADEHSGVATCALIGRAVRQGFVVTRGQARSDGLDEPAVRRLLRSGWTQPHRGTLTPLRDLDVSAAAVVRAAAVATARPGSVLVGAAAAAAQGLPLLSVPQRVVLITARSNGHTGGLGFVVRHGDTAADVTRWFGVPVTTVARTVVDLAREYGVAPGLVAADAALRAGLVDGPLLRDGLERRRGERGWSAAERAIALADPGAESVLETLTRLCLLDARIPAPVLQHWVRTDRGWFRVDMAWPERCVALEADGRLKYVTADELWREKLRQEALERAGWTVVRVVWDDVRRRSRETADRVRHALSASSSRPESRL